MQRYPTLVSPPSGVTTRDVIFVDEKPGDEVAYRHGYVLIGDEFIWRQALKLMLDGLLFRQRKIVTHYQTRKGCHRLC
jgi:hypothetical protein